MSHKRLFPIFVLILIAFSIFLAFHLGQSNDAFGAIDPDIVEGVSWLKAQETKDVTSVDTILKAQLHQELMEYRDEYMSRIQSGEINVWSSFQDYILLGDSRAVGFEYYGFLDESRVWAEGGATIRDLSNSIPAITEMNPSYLYLCYGLNDVSIGYWVTPEEYITEFSAVITELKNQLPETTIIISSILIARDPAFERASAWYNIPEYSAAVAEMCTQFNDVYFVNNDDITETYADYWDSDGIHLNKEFYPYWAANMIMAAFDSEFEKSEEPYT